MKINLVTKENLKDLPLAIGVFKNASGNLVFNQDVSKEIIDIIKYALNKNVDIYKIGEQKVLHLKKGRTFAQIIIFGLGENTELNSLELRNAGANLIKTVKAEKFPQILCYLPHPLSEISESSLQAFLEGCYLGDYSYERYKSTKNNFSLSELLIVDSNLDIERFTLIDNRALVLSKNVCLARDLSNMPANDLTPKKFVKIAEKAIKKLPLKIDVLSDKDMQKLNMNALLAVASGSNNSPYTIVLTYQGNPASSELLALVGKGVTFDSGGISLKPAEGMQEMKDDMSGAATVLSTILATAELNLPCNIVAILPCVENMPSGSAYRPGDVITAMNGKTIEIISTDAEGRLILADAVAYAEQLGATKIVDVATLTGACMVALGNLYAGSITNNMDFHSLLMLASEKTAEKVWLMPNDSGYKKLIKSDIADIKNSGGRFAGMITGGLFIEEFVSKAWIHLDIAPTATVPESNGYICKGATGYGVRLLVQLAQEVF